jgi:competence protein ComEA
MLRFDWALFATDELLVEVAASAGVPASDARALAPVVALILEAEGGLPFVAAEVGAAERTLAARRLLHGAVRAALAATGVTRSAPAHVLRPLANPRFAVEAVAAEPIAVNIAGAAAFEALPGIGPAVARRIVDERRSGGDIRDAGDLDRRVAGVGETIVERVKTALSFAGAAAVFGRVAAHDDDLAADLRRLIGQAGSGEPAARLAAALEFVLSRSLAEPRPRGPRPLADVSPPAQDPAFASCDQVAMLAGSDYFRVVPELIGAAAASVDVAMFHAAAPSANHPTRRMLDALIAAHERGAAVRVLFDSDRPSDPYASSVINTPAKRLLESRGVPVRFDAPERLMHSKFIVIDRAAVVIGSHNWSAGSFFHFDDLSVVIDSAALAQDFAERFAALWG